MGEKIGRAKNSARLGHGSLYRISAPVLSRWRVNLNLETITDGNGALFTNTPWEKSSPPSGSKPARTAAFSYQLLSAPSFSPYRFTGSPGRRVAPFPHFGFSRGASNLTKNLVQFSGQREVG